MYKNDCNLFRMEFLLSPLLFLGLIVIRLTESICFSSLNSSFKDFFYFWLCIYVCVHSWTQKPAVQRAGGTAGGASPREFWEPESGLLEENSKLLVAETFLHTTPFRDFKNL